MAGSFKRYEEEERHALHLLGVASLAIVWWVALWGLVDEGFQWAAQKSGMKVRNLYIAALALLLVVFLMYPQLLSGL